VKFHENSSAGSTVIGGWDVEGGKGKGKVSPVLN
jgi:hypothetical protein